MKEIKFIDLFAGIGGFRLGLESIGAKCVFSSEIDEHAIAMYQENFHEDSKCDITKLNPDNIPDFDILCAGFPCQSFSISGKQKGFEDATRGTLFFDICRILKVKQPPYFILENVKNLEMHDKGNTLYVMLRELNNLGYSVSYKVLNAKDFGVPQNRERIILVGSKNGKIFDFDKVETNPVSSMKDFLDEVGEFEYLTPEEYTLIEKHHVKQQPRSGLRFVGYRNKKMRTIGVRKGTEHLSRVHKQPNRIYSSDGIHPTISSQEQSGRYWILHKGKVRKLTIDECYTFMGFPKEFKKIGLRSKLYERIGNSVCVPMIARIAESLREQFYNNIGGKMTTPELLESLYREAGNIKNISELSLESSQLDLVKNIVEKEETFKGVYTVLVTSLIYKIINPTQDIRRHQANMENGYSGRSFDTKYITPFMKQKKFLGAMKESGWLTRSLEQNLPYNLDFPGKINNKLVKSSFLQILHDIEENDASPREYIIAIFYLSIVEKNKKSIQLINPIVSESTTNISEIIELLSKHFYYPYKSRGASILPVVALYSVYECIMGELKRFEGKKLQPLASHHSSDRSSGNTGDIVITNENNELYEVIEVKFDISPDSIMIDDAYKKFSSTSIQRYYILSTFSPEDSEIEKIHDKINQIKNEHGCQVIVNGVIPTLKYYLRLLDNTDKFVETYVRNIENNHEINAEHKLAWNSILKNK
ncbi:DNA cytosine methyltransferase [Streptococcus pluranimalium]|uniref:DNA cytosine methyltransferase n=1 Tax=Streptococcus pluranimalium TaxID=82348 RepID=UPI003F692226